MKPADFPKTANERKIVRDAFSARADMSGLCYYRREIENGDMFHLLYDPNGYCLIASKHGMFELIRFSIDKNLTILEVN